MRKREREKIERWPELEREREREVMRGNEKEGALKSGYIPWTFNDDNCCRYKSKFVAKRELNNIVSILYITYTIKLLPKKLTLQKVFGVAASISEIATFISESIFFFFKKNF